MTGQHHGGCGDSSLRRERCCASPSGRGVGRSRRRAETEMSGPAVLAPWCAGPHTNTGWPSASGWPPTGRRTVENASRRTDSRPPTSGRLAAWMAKLVSQEKGLFWTLQSLQTSKTELQSACGG
eukprot:351879-Chlamydomonas_euryale.AAC.20